MPPQPEKAPSPWGQLIPASSSGMYALIPGGVGFLTVLGVFVASFVTGKPIPLAMDSILLASVAMLGIHTGRATLADKRNAENGIAPVPYEGGPVETVDDFREEAAPQEAPPEPETPPAPYFESPAPQLLPVMSQGRPEAKRKRIPAI